MRVDPRTKKVIGKVAAGHVYGFGSLWDTTSSGNLLRIDPHTGKIVAQIRVQGPVNWQPQIAVGSGAVWVASADRHRVERINPKTNRVSASIAGISPADSLLAIGVAFGSVLVDENTGANGQGHVYRINPTTKAIIATIRASHGGSGQYGATQLAFGSHSVWVGNANSTLSRIDRTSNRVLIARQIPLDAEFIAYGLGSIWVCDDSGSAARISVGQF